MIRRVTACLLAAAIWCEASDPVAIRLAREARKAENAGEIVRAYLLFAEAASRDPQSATYRANRDALAPAAKLLTKANVQDADITAEIKKASEEADASKVLESEPPVELVRRGDWERAEQLAPPPKLTPNAAPADFNLRGDAKTVFEQIAAVYGIHPVFDPDLDLKSTNIHFEIAGADFHSVMEALTAATGTFIFATSPRQIFVARDSELKRNEYEPNVLITFPLPEALNQKDLIEAANAARGALNLRTIGWDSTNRTVMIRDRATRARLGRSVLESLLLPRAQVSFEVQILTINSDVAYHYGLALPTSAHLAYFGKPGGFKSILPSFSNAMTFLAFGGGASLFGVSLADANLFATYSNAFSTNLYDATVVVDGGQTANFHIGDKYPIAQTLNSAAGQNSPSAALYNPIGQVSLEDLGIVLKLTPRINRDGDISLDVEAASKALGTQTIETVPEILQREFKGTVSMHEGEWAVLAGLDQKTVNASRTGLIGLSQIPGIREFLSENSRETQSSKTLLVIKPTITRLPMSISPEFLVGPLHGERVLL